MKTHRSFLMFLVALILLSLACSSGIPAFSQIETGPTESLTVDEPHQDNGAAVDVNLSMAVGELHLSGGAQNLLEGEVRYNVADWKPTITSTETSLSLAQDEVDEIPIRFPGDDLINTWDLKLGSVPMNLSLRADAYDAAIDLSGLPLRGLDVQDGASQVEIRFDTLNPEELKKFTYRTGTSQIEFYGLANANFRQMTFDGGTGQYIFDFSGELRRDATVNIDVGVSTLEIVVPAGVPAQVLPSQAVGEVRVSGDWQSEAGQYVNPGNGPQLTITVEMGAGELSLSNP